MSGIMLSVAGGSFGTVRGEALYTTPGTYTWVAPSGVTSVSVLVVGAGGQGASIGTEVVCCITAYYGGGGGGGGGLAYLNNYSVTPGSSYTVTVNSTGNSNFNGSTVVGAGVGSNAIEYTGGSGGSGTGTSATKYNGGIGGNGASGTNDVRQINGGGGGAAGYAGTGGAGAVATLNVPNAGQPAIASSGGGGGGGTTGSRNTNSGAGGGVGIYGSGTTGSGGAAGSSTVDAYRGDGGSSGVGGGQSQTGGNYGGGGAGGGSGSRGSAAVRIIYPGNTRSFPSTDVGTP